MDTTVLDPCSMQSGDTLSYSIKLPDGGHSVVVAARCSRGGEELWAFGEQCVQPTSPTAGAPPQPQTGGGGGECAFGAYLFGEGHGFLVKS
eukprot:gene56055-52770_t